MSLLLPLMAEEVAEKLKLSSYRWEEKEETQKSGDS
jgi:hypothetical protein